MRLRLAALVLSSGVGAALIVALWLGSETTAALAGVAAMGAAALAGRKVAVRQPTASWCVRGDGRVSVRWGRRAACSDGVSAVFVSSGLIVLRDGMRTLEVWRDATPSKAFRRLSVAIRWHVGRPEPAVLFD